MKKYTFRMFYMIKEYVKNTWMVHPIFYKIHQSVHSQAVHDIFFYVLFFVIEKNV